jgi:hypothetical protein
MRGPDGWRMQPFLFAAQALPETDLGPVAVKPTCRPSTLMPLIDSVLASRRIAAPSLLCVHHGWKSTLASRRITLCNTSRLDSLHDSFASRLDGSRVVHNCPTQKCLKICTGRGLLLPRHRLLQHRPRRNPRPCLRRAFTKHLRFPPCGASQCNLPDLELLLLHHSSKPCTNHKPPPAHPR